MTESLTFIPRYFTSKGISTFLIVSLLAVLVFFNKALPLTWIAFNLVEVLLFFRLSSSLSLRWADIPVKAFTKRLATTAFLIRLVWVVFSYFFSLAMTQQPFEFESADAIGYHEEGKWLVSLIKRNMWEVYVAYIGTNYSDMGYPFYLGMLYYAFGDSVLIPRLIKAVLGTLTCVLVYRIGRSNFGESTGRMAGIMTMLVPNLIYYCGLHVKETELVFLSVCFLYFADKLLRERRIRTLDWAWLALLGASLFFFRTVLAACMVGSVGIAAFFSAKRISTTGRRFGLLMLVVAGLVFISTTPLVNAINEYLEASDHNLTSQMDNFANREGGNKYARYGSRSIFLPFMLIVPFPTLVDTGQLNAMMLGGAYFTRNVYAFFVFVALFALYRHKQLWSHTLLLAFIGSYVLVLASSGFALSERFHLPLVPFLLILAAHGISRMNRQNVRYFKPYLVMVALLVIAWNWFKLAGRS